MATATQQQKLTAALTQLEDGIQALATSGDWQAYLKVQAHFHHYSARNCMFIMAQMPSATQVAGYRAWQRLNRQVKKGEKAILIFAPMTRKVKDDDSGDDPQKRKIKIFGFKTANVFDISQTEGDDLPEPCQLLTGDDLGLIQSLRAFAQAQGFVTELGDCNGANGYCQYRADGITIRVNSLLPPLQQAKTLAHELGHALLHNPEDYRMHSLTGVKELEAESVAYVVLNAMGFASDGYSFGYVSTWMDGTDDAIAQLKASADRIQGAAKQIIDGLERSTTAPALAA